MCNVLRGLAVAQLLAVIPLALGQDAVPPPPDEHAAISMDVRRVVLYVTVREGKTGFVGDLAKENFVVKEDGQVQQIRQFTRDDVPVSVGLVIDNSQSMLNKRSEVVAAAKAFIAASNPSDETFIVHFNDKVSFGLSPDHPFSSDRAELDSAIDHMALRGETALYDAIQAALEHLKKAPVTKQALFVISDGGDNRSTTKMKDVIKAAELSGALFYAIGIYDPMDGDANPDALKKLAQGTGGEAFFPQTLAEVSGLCESIARDLRNQYTLVYAPPERINDASFHKIDVSVKDPKRRKLTVRSRSGYYGSAATAGKKRGSEK
jgi:VWFA-related protein